jgi:large conductance mechanosensitive channel
MMGRRVVATGKPQKLRKSYGNWLEKFLGGSKISHQANCTMFKEFKEFALKGNLVDLAVAFVMGAAFVKLSTSFIEDLVMPWVGKISGGADFSNLFLGLSDKVNATNLVAAKVQGPVFAYGNFITIMINFFIVAFVMFLVVKVISKAKAMAATTEAAAAAAAPPTADQALLTEIRDLLKHKA